jgi:CHAD domain-containing protein
MRPGTGLRRAFATRHRALTKHVAAAVEGDERAVHQARVATRRLREALPVLGAGLPRKRVRKLRRRMRKLTRLFGAVRERDVALKMLDDRQVGGSVDTPGAEKIRTLVCDGRNAARNQLLDTLDVQRVARWMGDVKTFEDELDQPAMQADTGWQIVLAQRLLRSTERLRHAINDAGMLFVSDRLHAVRVALKKLRYAVELAAELSASKLDATLEELKSGQDTLGELHDVDMLMCYTTSALEAETDGHIHAALEALLAKLEAERHELHARYLTQQPSLLVLTDRISDQVVPRFTMARAGARAGAKAGARALRRELPQDLRSEEPAERTGTAVRR